eukprot:461434-Pelagomonas_calceolata.AAC.13
MAIEPPFLDLGPLRALCHSVQRRDPCALLLCCAAAVGHPTRHTVSLVNQSDGLLRYSLTCSPVLLHQSMGAASSSVLATAPVSGGGKKHGDMHLSSSAPNSRGGSVHGALMYTTRSVAGNIDASPSGRISVQASCASFVLPKGDSTAAGEQPPTDLTALLQESSYCMDTGSVVSLASNWVTSTSCKI